jgi:hypothetical protein
MQKAIVIISNQTYLNILSHNWKTGKLNTTVERNRKQNYIKIEAEKNETLLSLLP